MSLDLTTVAASRRRPFAAGGAGVEHERFIYYLVPENMVVTVEQDVQVFRLEMVEQPTTVGERHETRVVKAGKRLYESFRGSTAPRFLRHAGQVTMSGRMSGRRVTMTIW